MSAPANTHADAMEQAVAWFVRLDDGPLSDSERAEFDAWRAIPAHAQCLIRVERMWADFGDVPEAERQSTTECPPVTIADTDNRRILPFPSGRRAWRTAGLALAASLALALGISLDLPMRLQSDIRAGLGETVTRSLPDGSTITLDSNSAVTVEMTPERRTIRLLRGEALFSVASDPARPFVVETEGGSARALGTRFSVRRDPFGATVTVLESHVRVTCCQSDSPTTILSPGQRVSYTHLALGDVNPVDAESETAWTRGKLIFTNRPLGQVVAELNRHYVGRILIQGEELNARPVSGVFATTDPLTAVAGLEESLGLTSTRLGPWLVIVHDEKNKP